LEETLKKRRSEIATIDVANALVTKALFVRRRGKN
jgi:hypothetical protein